MTLRRQLLGSALLIVLVSSAITLAVGGLLTRRASDRSVLEDVSQQADLIAERERAALLPLGHLGSLRSFLARQDERVVVAPLGRGSTYLDARAAARLRAAGKASGTEAVAGKDWFYAARPVAGKALVLLRPRVVGTAAWRPFAEGLLIASGAGALLAVALSLLLGRRISRPLQRVAEASRRLAAGRSPDAVPEEGAAELVSLAGSFNAMAARLGHARDAERAFLLSVSHELKTPLTAVIGYAEGLADGKVDVADAARTIAREAERLERLVGDVLDLARISRHEFSARREPVDLVETARACVDRHEPRARELGVELALEGIAGSRALGDGDRVLQALSNLVENALRVAPPGGRVRVHVAPGLLAVEDDGPGLAPDDLPHAFERFFLHRRYADSRPVGTGLGLAIVHQLAEAMGGSVAVESEPGRTRFTLRLPAISTLRGTRPSAPPPMIEA